MGFPLHGCSVAPGWILWALLATLVVASRAWSAMVPPEEVVAAFCERDGRGDRLRALSWQQVAPLIDWTVEPSWDHVVVIRGLRVVGTSRQPGAAEVQVDYTVVGEISGRGATESEHIETVRYQLVQDRGGWRILGPPPAPHLYDTFVDRDAMIAALAPDSEGYKSNSVFLADMFHAAHWIVPYHPVADLVTAPEFSAVAEPRVGDVVAYLHAGAPYHAGIYEGEDRVVSATIGAGTVHAPMNAFAGEVRYLRVHPLEAPPTPEVVETPSSGETAQEKAPVGDPGESGGKSRNPAQGTE